MTLLIGLHLFSALLALVLGGMLLALPKGRGWHRPLGRIWIGGMVIACLSSFGLSSHMMGSYFSPLHGLALFTLVMVWKAFYHARRGQISAHRKVVQGLYWGALVVPGIFAIILPGRFLNDFFSQSLF
jgi:uncharacterized membrane protein